MPSSADAPSVVTGGSFFSWSSSKFRYSGRVEKEILEDSMLGRDEPSITRSSIRRKANSVPATPSTPIASDLGERFLPVSCQTVTAVCYSTSDGGVVSLRPPSFTYVVYLSHSSCNYDCNITLTAKQTKPPCLAGKIHKMYKIMLKKVTIQFISCVKY